MSLPPILRMNLCRSIDEAMARGKQLGYSNVDELLDIVDYLTTFSPPFSESAPVATPMNAILEWPMCMPAPVDGKVVEAYNVDGTYYSDAESEGEDPGGLNDSQVYTTAIAARAVIVIDSISSAIGEIACVFVGMAEVSSCQIVVRPGDDVRKGDELVFFQFGGSTYCLLFQPGVIERFVPKPPWHDDVPPLRVNSALAYARKNARSA